MKRTFKLLIAFLIKPVITPLWLGLSVIAFTLLSNYGHPFIGLAIFIVTMGLFLLLNAFEKEYQHQLAQEKINP